VDSSVRSQLTSEASAFGELLGEDTLRFIRHFDAPVERVWRAVVTPEGLRAWLAQVTALDARVGGAFELRFSDDDRMQGRILEFEPERRLVLAWYETSAGVSSEHTTPGHDGSVVTFDLAPAPVRGTDLVFTHRYVRSGDRMIGFGAGWHAHFDALAASLAEHPSSDRDDEYRRLRPEYELRFR
jgi:uncharacterized protein YndB with AHSA1/START domain